MACLGLGALTIFAVAMALTPLTNGMLFVAGVYGAITAAFTTAILQVLRLIVATGGRYRRVIARVRPSGQRIVAGMAGTEVRVTINARK